MLNFQKLLDLLSKFYENKRNRAYLGIGVGVLFSLAVLELGLNFWIRSALRQQFISQSGSGYRLEARVGWINLTNVASGKVKYIQVKANNCMISGLRYKYISIDNQGIEFNLPRLLEKKGLLIEKVGKTRVQGVITETDLTEYLVAKYSEFKPDVLFFPKRILIAGKAKLFGRETSVQIEGKLDPSGPKTLRFFPEEVLIAKRKVPQELLKFISTQLPLNFTIMKDWPLQISDLILKERVLEISLREMSS